MRARGRGMTWWARTAQKSGSRLLPNAAVPVWLSSALRTSAMAPEKNLALGAQWSQNGPQKRVLRRKLGLETVSSGSDFLYFPLIITPWDFKRRT